MTYLQLFKGLLWYGLCVGIAISLIGCTSPKSKELVFLSYHDGCVTGAEKMYETLTREPKFAQLTMALSELCAKEFQKLEGPH